MSDKLKLSSQVCFPVYTLAKEVINLYRPILKALDLTYPQYLVMLVLWETNEQKVSEIGEKLNLDSGTLTPLLKRLALKELITRSRNPEDERTVIISLTAAGQKLEKVAERVPDQMMSAMNAPVESLEKLKHVIENILIKIKENENTV